MLAVLEVKVLPDTSFLHFLAAFGPLMIAAGAVAAAGIAWKTAHKVRRDDDRREVLDSTLAKLEDAKKEYGTLISDIEEADDARAVRQAEFAEDPGSETEQEMRQAISRWGDGLRPQWDLTFRRVREFNDSLTRLRLRFYEHELSKRAEVMPVLWDEIQTVMAPVRARNLTADEEAKAMAIHEELRNANSRFLDGCAAWFAGKLD